MTTVPKAPGRPSIKNTILADLALALATAWLLSVGWGWFVVPMGAPPIGVAHAYGLRITLLLAVEGKSSQHASTDSEYREFVATRVVVLLLALLALALTAWVM